MSDLDSIQSTGGGNLTTQEALAWNAFLKAHAAVVRGLDVDLRAAHGLTLGDFEILMLLGRDSCQPLRMTALADSALLSPSGLSRAIERLEARQLVRRDRCPEDRRGILAQLTETGAALMETASTTQAGAVRRRFLQRLTPRQLELLTEAWQSVLVWEDGSCYSCSGLHQDEAGRNARTANTRHKCPERKERDV
jgi:DNA-binding MarR family transcriptional regulator